MGSRMEAYLNAAISGNTENLPNPISRIDFLLCELIKTLGESGASIEEVEKIVTDKVAEIVADAPEDFDTLKELSDWIYTHEESAAAMNAAIQSKVDKEEGKSLISDSEITRLANVKNYDDTQVRADISSMNAAVKNDIALDRTTLGTQCKNLLKNTAVTTTKSGITFTVNDDKSITVSGTATSRIIFLVGTAYISQTGNYTYTGTPSGGASSTYSMNYRNSNVYKTAETGNGITAQFEGGKTYEAVIDIRSGVTISNLTFSPMLRDADITDDTYEPYKENVDERLIENKSDIAVNKSTLGYQCKNLLKNTAVTTTKSGITFTVNSDGSVTVNGTNTSSGTIYIQLCGLVDYGNSKLIASIGQNTTDVYMAIYDSDWNWIGTGSAGTISFENSSKKRLVRLVVKPGVTINNVTVYPMLRYADITDDTYEPYKASVDERLIQNKSDIVVNKSDIAVNKSALGYQHKNLLPYPKSIVKGGITFTCDENGYMTGSNTTNDTRQWTSANAQYSMYLEAGTYYFSSFAETVCTNSDGRAYIIANGAQIVGLSTRETHVEKSFTLSEATTIYVMAKVYDGKVAFMIRDADIIDDTYEPYQPSLYEQIIALEARIAALEA